MEYFGHALEYDSRDIVRAGHFVVGELMKGLLEDSGFYVAYYHVFLLGRFRWGWRGARDR